MNLLENTFITIIITIIIITITTIIITITTIIIVFMIKSTAAAAAGRLSTCGSEQSSALRHPPPICFEYYSYSFCATTTHMLGMGTIHFHFALSTTHVLENNSSSWNWVTKACHQRRPNQVYFSDVERKNSKYLCAFVGWVCMPFQYIEDVHRIQCTHKAKNTS